MVNIGKVIEALKWAATTKPEWKVDKEKEARQTVGSMFMPLRSDSVLVLVATIILFFGVAGFFVLIGIDAIFSVPLILVVLWLGTRASSKLCRDWVNENYEIEIRKKDR